MAWSRLAAVAERRVAGLLIGAVVGINVLAALAATAFVYTTHQATLREVATRTSETAGIVDHAISADAQRVNMALQTAVDALQLQLARHGRLRATDVDALLLQQQRLVGSGCVIRATDASGAVLYGPDIRPEALASWAERDFFPALRDHPDAPTWVTAPILGKVGHLWVIAFVRRYHDAGGRFAGVVSAAVPVDYFARLLQIPALGPQGIALLRDAHGDLIARHPPNPNQAIGQHRYSTELQRAIDSGVAATTFHAVRTGDGVERIDSFRRMTMPPFFLVTGMANDDALHGWRTQRNMVGIALAAFALLSAWVGWLLWLAMLGARQQMLRSQALLRSASDAIHVLDSAGNVVEASDAFCRMLGYSLDEVLGMNLHTWMVDAEFDRIEQIFHRLLGSDQQRTFETRYRRRDGSAVEVELTTLPLQLGGRRLLFAAARDISGRRRTEEQLRIAAVAFQSRDGIMVTDAGGRILQVNQSFCQVTGYSPAELVGQRPSMLSSGRQDAGFYRRLWEAIGKEGHWEGQLWNRRRDGGVYPEWVSISAVRSVAGAITHYVATYSGISDAREAERRILELAFYDPLTGLPNRRLLMDRLQQALGNSHRSQRWGAVLLLDLDHFKTINDSRGHDFGDVMLIETASRLRDNLRTSDSASRLGGDEFVVLLEDLGASEDHAAASAERVAEKLLQALQQPLQHGDGVFHLSASIGIALFDGSPPGAVDALLKQADLAMYAAKASGRAAIRFFDPQMQAAIDRRVALEGGLRVALQRDELQLFYQPQVDAGAHIVGVEALLRWNSPEFGSVTPLEFIALAEDNGLILTLGQRVLDDACRQLAAWSADPLRRDWVVAVNVSARQFRQRDFAAQVAASLRLHGAAADRLKLELTESVLLKDIAQAIDTMQAVRALGVGFSLDDFGTGYSSLSYLKRLPLQQLKIDASFVRDLAHSPDDRAIVRAIVALGQNLGLQVLAEGVETREQFELLLQLGCALFQGNWFSPAVAVDALPDRIDTAHSTKAGTG